MLSYKSTLVCVAALILSLVIGGTGFGLIFNTKSGIATLGLQQPLNRNIVKVAVYYETFCPACVQFITERLAPIVQTLSQYLNIDLIPYGFAETSEENGKITFKCQHKEKECYGNKLHASVIDLMRNNAAATIFNACLMNHTHTDGLNQDDAVRKCAEIYHVNANAIIQSAKSERGSQLLKIYGERTRALGTDTVPTVLVNGNKIDFENLKDLFSIIWTLIQNPYQNCFDNTGRRY